MNKNEISLIELIINDWNERNFSFIDKFHKILIFEITIIFVNFSFIFIIKFLNDNQPDIWYYIIIFGMIISILGVLTYLLVNKKSRLIIIEQIISNIFSDYDNRYSFKKAVIRKNIQNDQIQIEKEWLKYNIDVKSEFFLGYLLLIGLLILEGFFTFLTIFSLLRKLM